MLTKIATVSAAAALVSIAGAAHAQVFVNGSLTDTPSVSTPPAGWSAWSGTADTVDASGPFNYTPTPWTLSPDGGTFVRTGRGPSVSEGISQIVSGFVVGAVYQVDFFTTNLGFQDPASGSWNGGDGYYDFFVDGVLTDTSTVIGKQALASDPIVWTAESVTFVATSGTLELAFAANWAIPGGPAAYMGIDGFRLSQVPAPGVLATLGGLALIGRRRRG